MANYIPLKNYMFYCLDKLIYQYKIEHPFLDAGCGIGDLSYKLGLRGWSGKAIDFSANSIKLAKENLKEFKNIKVENSSLIKEKGRFNSVFLFDVLEHIKDDESALKKIESLLTKGGFLVIVVPYNPVEWRWDDEFYGHYRRYTLEELEDKLFKAGLRPMVIWNCTFPIFWLMRRLYTCLWKMPAGGDKLSSTKKSSMRNAWDIPILSKITQSFGIVWQVIYKFQFLVFRNYLKTGHEVIVLAERTT